MSHEMLSTTGLITTWWWVAQHALLTAGLVLLVALVCRCIPKRPALQHLLWLVVLVKFLTPPVIVWPVSATDLAARLGWSFERQVTRDAQPPENAVVESIAEPAIIDQENFATAAVEEVIAEPASPAFATHAIPVQPPTAFVAPVTGGVEVGAESNSVQAAVKHEVTDNPIDSANNHAIDPESSLSPKNPKVALVASLGLLLAWIVGGIVVTVRLLRRLAVHRRIALATVSAPGFLSDEVARVARRLNVPPIPVRVSDKTSSPFVWCAGRLRLIWPAVLTEPEQLERWQGVLAHELAHIRRRDHWTSWLELVAGIVWWWNPLFWFARRRLRESAEMACDALAVETLPDRRREYAEAFLTLSLPLKSRALLPVLRVESRDRQSFERRLSMILSPNVVGRVSKPGIWAILLLSAVVLPGWSSGETERSAADAPATSTATAADAESRQIAPEDAPTDAPATVAEEGQLLPSSKLTLEVGTEAVRRLPNQAIRRTIVGDPSIVEVILNAPDELKLIAKKPGPTFIQVRNEKQRLTTIELLVVDKPSASAADGAAARPETVQIDESRVVGTLTDEIFNSALRRQDLQRQRADIERQMAASSAEEGAVLALTLGIKLATLELNDVRNGELGTFRGGLKIKSIVAKSEAERAGLRAGDIIVGIGKYETIDMSGFHVALRQAQTEAALFTLRRGGETWAFAVETQVVGLQAESLPTPSEKNNSVENGGRLSDRVVRESTLNDSAANDSPVVAPAHVPTRINAENRYEAAQQVVPAQPSTAAQPYAPPQRVESPNNSAESAPDPALVGRWKLIFGMDGENRISQDIRPDFTANMLTFRGGKVEGTVPYRVDLAKNPREIDITLPDGQVMRGIYEFRDAHLVVCVNESDGPRPTSFAVGKPDRERNHDPALMIFEREVEAASLYQQPVPPVELTADRVQVRMFDQPAAVAARAAATHAAPDVDITNLGVSIIEARGEVELAHVSREELNDAFEHSQETATRIQLKEATIKELTATRKLQWLMKIAQSTYDAAKYDAKKAQRELDHKKTLGDKGYITRQELELQRDKVEQTERRLEILESILGTSVKEGDSKPAAQQLENPQTEEPQSEKPADSEPKKETRTY